MMYDYSTLPESAQEDIVIFEVNIKEWRDSAIAYRERKEYVDNLIQLQKWLDQDDIVYERQNILEYIDERIEQRVEERKAIKERSQKNRLDKIEHAGPAAEPDDVITLEEKRNIIERFDGKPSRENIEKDIRNNKETVAEQREHIITTIQVVLEKIKLITCRTDVTERQWKRAGNIILPLYENYFRGGIMHEILTNVTSFEDDTITVDDFFEDLNFTDLEIDEE